MHVISLFIALFSLLNPTTSFVLTDDYTGEWEYKVDTPQGPYSGSIILEKAFEGYTGKVKSGEMTMEMTELKVEDNRMSFNLSFEGFPISISGEFEGDTYNAVVDVDGTKIPLMAKRKM